MKRHIDDVFLSSRLLLAALSGALSYFAYPKPGLWPLIFVSVAGLLISVRGATLGRAFSVGFVGGWTFFASQCWWLSQYLGPLPLVALATIEALIFGLGMVVYQWLYRNHSGRMVRVLVFASIWTAREWLSTHFPYGGFPWSRLSMSQADSPLANWVFFGGLSLLSFVVAFVTASLVEYVPNLLHAANRRRSLGVIAGVLAVSVAVPMAVTLQSSGEKFRVAAIQGNANAGLFAKTYPGEVLDNHLTVTRKMISDGKAKGVQLVVWPENASDLNPEFSPRANLELNSLVNRELKTPFTFGTITATESDIFNSSILWLPNGGFADQYDKKRPVPFAEFVPDRDFWYQLAPDLIGLISRGYTFGERDPIFEVDGKKFGVLICFEIAIDEITQDIVDSGAQAILSQTNNADFGRSDEAFQQLAIAKLRSIETGLPLVNASTVGPSAIFDGGDTLARSGAFEPAYLVADIGLSSSKTPAMVIGRYFDLANLLLAASLVSILIYRRRKFN